MTSQRDTPTNLRSLMARVENLARSQVALCVVFSALSLTPFTTPCGNICPITVARQ